MSDEAGIISSAVPPSWPILSLTERRVLGVLVEKAKTTPDAYPMSLNGLVTGCNQKSNRDPVLNLSEHDVQVALPALQKKGLVKKLLSSGRIDRWKHELYEAWKVNKVELAVLAELLLRGPQTEGELRGRASRMEPIDDLEALRTLLKPMVERSLVIYLTPEGRRGTMLTHGFHAPDELEGLRQRHGGQSDAASEDRRSETTEAQGHSAELRTEIASLRAEMGELRGKLADVIAQVQSLRESLGG